ncbi:hypothetical protein MKZ38_002137 [Zalerion maritima]|uniref:Uncharacterized protein n=1 Tax=Zalerion maritima TaxID=339359 RepID=A0AAD5RW78_9PEZI|nr:hypothetical protein MKZ38_002137 [Zalerion maritima]
MKPTSTILKFLPTLIALTSSFATNVGAYDQGQCHCNECNPGTYTCGDNPLEILVCDATGTWAVASECPPSCVCVLLAGQPHCGNCDDCYPVMLV